MATGPANAASGFFNPFGAVGDLDDLLEDEVDLDATHPALSATAVPVDRPTLSPGNRTSVSVLGMRMHCYRCGEATTVIAGIGIPPDDGKGKRGRRRDATESRWRYVPLPAVAMPLAAALSPDWFRLVFAGAVTLRRSDDAGPDAALGAWCNGCASCDAMLTDAPIQAAFAEAVGASGDFRSFALDSVYLPDADLERVLQGS